ncbi:hypothetical protein GCM10009798_42510 [Nocardioides panacihumi]|uniref:Uncharacterized protein n=1 Tax=Nocardioides panacihumi TaxID=400774 RepID=A0ABN2RYW3_9ACTN
MLREVQSLGERSSVAARAGIVHRSHDSVVLTGLVVLFGRGSDPKTDGEDRITIAGVQGGCAPLRYQGLLNRIAVLVHPEAAESEDRPTECLEVTRRLGAPGGLLELDARPLQVTRVAKRF